MKELFPNVPNEIRVAADWCVQKALELDNPIKAAESIDNFRNSLSDEQWRHYLDFTLYTKLMQRKGEQE